MKSRKSVVLLMAIASNMAFAKHYFNVCFYNQTNAPISYNNNGISKKWLHRGELTGSGMIESGTNKCFAGVEDETVFSTDYITFYVNGKWFGIVNAGFRKPYAISQEATSTSSKDGKLPHAVVGGQDTYGVNVHVTDKGTILSGDSDLKLTDSYITPRVFK